MSVRRDQAPQTIGGAEHTGECSPGHLALSVSGGSYSLTAGYTRLFIADAI